MFDRQVKIRQRRKVIFQDGRLVRKGEKFYEVIYTAGRYWEYIEFRTLAEAKEFAKTLKVER